MLNRGDGLLERGMGLIELLKYFDFFTKLCISCIR